jgi:hypothetical protein
VEFMSQSDIWLFIHFYCGKNGQPGLSWKTMGVNLLTYGKQHHKTDLCVCVCVSSGGGFGKRLCLCVQRQWSKQGAVTMNKIT